MQVKKFFEQFMRRPCGSTSPATIATSWGFSSPIGKMVHFSAMSRRGIVLCLLSLLPLATTQCSRSTATSDQQQSSGGQSGKAGKSGKGGGAQGGGGAVPVS